MSENPCVTFSTSQRISEEGEDSGSDSDSEVDFYYTEIEVNVENVTQGFSDMTCVSQVSPSHHVNNNITVPQTFVIPDHDYQKKVWYINLRYTFVLQ